MLYLQIRYNKFVYKTITIFLSLIPFAYFHLLLLFGSVYIYKICALGIKVELNKVNY